MTYEEYLEGIPPEQAFDPAYLRERLGRLIFEYDRDLAAAQFGLCHWCHAPRSNERPDACLGEIDGVKNACCGHGIMPPYVELEDELLADDLAIIWFAARGKGPGTRIFEAQRRLTEAILDRRKEGVL